ncbi:complement C3-like [Denticeps clupeoides]|uniref:complement C3-like n=1 Tax=Denticeps clupeoides TaxID=299321 RepID=UPI0010A4D0C7|nr:complement C3-like [Denticeps clupeoides]
MPPELFPSSYVMSAPNLLRVGTPERVFVEAQDYEGANIDVRITVKSFPSKKLELVSRTVTLNATNGYQYLADMTIPEGREFFDEDSSENQYVYLQAQFPSGVLEKITLVSFQSGYVFVQTDKTVYTPGSTVKYRILSMSPGLLPVETGISVEVLSPDGIFISRKVIYPNKGMKSEELKIPDVVSLGIWKVVTRFQSTPQRNFTVEFEIKEYVLPSFEVTLTCKKPFFHVDDEQLSIDIEARYLYGKEVSGTAFVVFGVMRNSVKRSLPGSLRRVEIRGGRGEAVLKREQILQTFPDVNQLVHSSIYISVSVQTDTGNWNVGEMVEAQKQGIQIVTSPYTIHLKKTPKYFKPGMFFDVSVYVTNPDRSPAGGVPIEVTSGESALYGVTKANGLARVSINTLQTASVLPITVKTKAPDLAEGRQAEKQMTAQAYKTPKNSKNYLHIGVDAAELAIGQQVKISLNLLGNSPGVQNQDLTYLIVNKGQIVRGERFKRQGQSLVIVSLPVTEDMVPSFRIVAYYHVGSSEVVSDSAWVDVKDTCMGTLKVELVNPQVAYWPNKPFSLSITGDPGAKVGLVAVDKAVYVLNNQHRLTQTKIWDTIESQDPGCSPGSGKDSMGVFYDAGLVFVSSSAGGTKTRTSAACPAIARRNRRSAPLADVQSTLASQYSGGQRWCCMDGMKESLMGYNCERRAEYVNGDAECVRTFLSCCKEAVVQREESKTQQLHLARSEDEDDLYLSSEDVVSRSQFPESWLWEDVVLPQCPVAKMQCSTTSIMKGSFLKDSITSWQIVAISVSKTHGICVAKPLEMTVVKSFFIDLLMPFSSKRGEQLEIRAVLNNNDEDQIKVRVELMETEHVCSVASKRGSYQTTVELDAMSSRVVPFVIVPMALGLHTIEVKAIVFASYLNDGIKKDLHVVPEGVLTRIEVMNLHLNPSQHNGVQHQEVRSGSLRRRVPNTPASTHLRVRGPETKNIVEDVIHGGSMGSFLIQPHGNGETNLVTMTQPLIATFYLDQTNQWDKVGVDLREKALRLIKAGYQEQLAYRKADGSYGAFLEYPSSTWLTAFVVRVFSMASDIISINDNVLCNALKWLILKAQLPDGSFAEMAPVVYVQDSTGKIYGKDGDASLTAFVLISMQEGQRICDDHVSRLLESMGKATRYLNLRIQTLKSPYAVAMASYALASTEKLPKDILLHGSSPKSCFRSSDGTAWPVPGSHVFSLEATAYALLALLRMKEFEKTGAIVRWLNKQKQFVGGGYGSTQSTFMVYQAVAEYKRQIRKLSDINLEVNIDVSGRSKAVTWTFNRGNAFISRSDKLSLNQNLTVTAKGNSQGTFSVMTLYYALPSEKEEACGNFTLNLTLDKQPKVSYRGANATFLLSIDILYLSDIRDAGFTILTIGQLTGHIVDTNDLKTLSTGRERNIEAFEMDKHLSEKGSLVIYLSKVSHRRPDRVAFRVHKMLDVGALQPAAVAVYEYSHMESRCVKFYHPEKTGGALHRICHKDVCQCAEESCSFQRKEKVDPQERSFTACEPGMDYVYKVTVERKNLTAQTDSYHMKVNEVIKEGTDSVAVNAARWFISHPSCRSGLGLTNGHSYLIIGHAKDVIRTDGSFQYLLGERTWVEYWPTEEESKTREFRRRSTSIEQFMQDLLEYGCIN